MLRRPSRKRSASASVTRFTLEPSDVLSLADRDHHRLQLFWLERKGVIRARLVAAQREVLLHGARSKGHRDDIGRVAQGVVRPADRDLEGIAQRGDCAKVEVREARWVVDRAVHDEEVVSACRGAVSRARSMSPSDAMPVEISIGLPVRATSFINGRCVHLVRGDLVCGDIHRLEDVDCGLLERGREERDAAFRARGVRDPRATPRVSRPA